MQISDSLTELVSKISNMDDADAASSLSSMASADIHDVLMLLDQDHAARIAALLPTMASGALASVQMSGGVVVADLMEEPLGVVSAGQTAAGVVDHMVHTENVTEITYFYVVDEVDERLVGVVNLRDLILARPGQMITELMTPDPFVFRPDTPLSAAVQSALKRHYPAYPVADERGDIVGIVRGWRLFERVATDLISQAGSQVGVGREERVSTPILQAFKQRHPWLQVNLLTAFAAAFVVGMFEDTITRIVALAAFLPVLAGQSGNTGCQALAITLRGLTLGELNDYPVSKVIRKEVLLGALNGVCVGVVAGAAMWAYASATGASDPFMLAVVILIAMIGACMGSGIFGVVVPLTLKRFGADPATASSIFLTTFTDIIGMGLMLFLATTLVL
ncbi:MAG: magnesium transporter [Oceanococcus sp.]